MKPTITKLKNVRGRVTGYRAAIGPVQADASTPQEASEACEKATMATLARLNEGAKSGEWHGHAWIVVPSLNGWEYHIDGMSPGALSHEVRGSTRLEVIAHALVHLAQNVWEPSVTDDDAFVRDLPSNYAQSEIRGWVRFQRKIIIAKKHGKSDAEAFHMSGGMVEWPKDWEQVA